MTNEEISPGPVKTYPQGFGGAPGRIYVAAGAMVVLYIYIYNYRRKFRSQTSDNMDR